MLTCEALLPLLPRSIFRKCKMTVIEEQIGSVRSCATSVESDTPQHNSISTYGIAKDLPLATLPRSGGRPRLSESTILPAHNGSFIRLGFGDKTNFWRFKRLLDILTASALLLALAPLMLVVALLVTLTSPGPILFRQKRLGRHNKMFYCLKFRSMVVNAEAILAEDAGLLAEFGESFKLKNDPRITPIGAFLRKSSLDELPQLFNILCGDMTLIGPRPIVPTELEMYGMQSGKLLSVTPGLSGQWQASGRSSTTYSERVAMDMDYIDRRSMLLDFKLIAKTAVAVFRRNGAH